MATPAAGHGRMRASHADRERVVDALKAAFVQGRLTQDELDARVGQALAARTYADLAALTADLPAEPDRTPPPAPAPAPVPAPAPAPDPRNRVARRAVKVGAGTIGAVLLVTSGVGVVTGQIVAAVAVAVIMVILTAGATAFVAALVALTLKAESLHRNRSGRQLPPGPASGADGRASGADGPASPGPPPAGPPRPHRRRPPGSLAVGRAG